MGKHWHSSFYTLRADFGESKEEESKEKLRGGENGITIEENLGEP